MEQAWSDRVEGFWSSADDSDPDAVLSAMKQLVDERPPGDPRALFEWASAHDFVGREDQAIGLYRAALDAGLEQAARPQAWIQLGSSLRNVGELDSAIEVLAQVPDNAMTGDASRAFLALALYDAGRFAEALHVALDALAPTLPMYGRTVSAYAADLVADSGQGRPDLASL